MYQDFEETVPKPGLWEEVAASVCEMKWTKLSMLHLPVLQ